METTDSSSYLVFKFPEITVHFSFSTLIYPPPLARPDPNEEGINPADVQEWDRLNALELGKLKFYLTETIYKIVWKVETLTVLEFYG